MRDATNMFFSKVKCETKQDFNLQRCVLNYKICSPDV